MDSVENRIFSIKITYGSFNDIVNRIINYATGESRYVCVSNVHMLVEAELDADYSEKILGADLVTADGMPIIWALNVFNGIKQERVAGMDLLPEIVAKAEENKIPVFFYGGTTEMMSKTRDFLSLHYKSLVADYYSPPFRNLTIEEEKEIIEIINNSGARIVFVILGCPKQEKWMASMKGKINAILLGVGGALPVFIGEIKRAPKWMQNNALEWLFRLIQEPWRLFKRYTYTNSYFIYLVIRKLLNRNKH
jgi:N-acetylglucosaminyldiphosphoundecaprenol N-acetyl-beta-D-mannosaminyltransferase